MQLNMRLVVEEVNVTLEFPSSKEEGGKRGKKASRSEAGGFVREMLCHDRIVLKNHCNVFLPY